MRRALSAESRACSRLAPRRRAAFSSPDRSAGRALRLQDHDAEKVLVVEALRLQADAELLGRPVAGEDVLQQPAAQASPHAQLVAAAEEVERHQLLQEEQRCAGELRRLSPGGHRGQHPFDAPHHEDVAEEDALPGARHRPGRVGFSVPPRVCLPEPGLEIGQGGVGVCRAHDAPGGVEEHDRDVEDGGHPLHQLPHVLLLHDQLEQLDLQGGGAAQRLHVARRRPVGVFVLLVLPQRSLELRRVEADLVLQHDRRLEQPEVRPVDVGALLDAVHERVDDLVEADDLRLERRDVRGALAAARFSHLRPPRRPGPAEPKAIAVSVWLTCTPQNCSP